LQPKIPPPNSNAKVAFSPEEAQDINAKVNKFHGIKDNAQLDEAGKILAEELKTLIPAFLAKYASASEGQQKQLAGVKAKAEAIMKNINSFSNATDAVAIKLKKPLGWVVKNVKLSCPPSSVFISVDSSEQNSIANIHVLRTNEEIDVLPEQSKLQYIHTSSGGFIEGHYFLCVKCEDSSIVSEKIHILNGYGVKVELIVKQAFVLDENKIKNSFKVAIEKWGNEVQGIVRDASADINSNPDAAFEITGSSAALLAGLALSQTISKHWAFQVANAGVAIINAMCKSYAPDLTKKVSFNSFRTGFCNSINLASKDITAIDEAYLKFKTKYNISSASKLTYEDIDILIAKCIANDFPTGKIISLSLISNWIKANLTSGTSGIHLRYSARYIGEDTSDDVKFKFSFPTIDVETAQKNGLKEAFKNLHEKGENGNLFELDIPISITVNIKFNCDSSELRYGWYNGVLVDPAKSSYKYCAPGGLDYEGVYLALQAFIKKYPVLIKQLP